MPSFGPHGPIREPQRSPAAASRDPTAGAPPLEALPGLSETSLLSRAVDPFRLRLLLELERRGTISQAAEACSIGQPTASVHLQTLEAAVGQRLYERAGRGTRLTDAGRVVAAHAALVLSAMEDLQQELSALRDGLAGTLRLSVLDGFGNYVLPAVLAKFASEHPRADIRVRVARSGEVLQDVSRGDADLGVAGEIRRPPGVVTSPLLRDELVGIAPLGFPAIASVADLADAVLVLSTPASSTRAFVERLAGQVGWRPPRRLELDSVEAVKRAVQSGAGVAIVSLGAVSEELARGELGRFRLRGVGRIMRQIEMVRAEQRVAPPLERVFEESLREHVGRQDERRFERTALSER